MRGYETPIAIVSHFLNPIIWLILNPSIRLFLWPHSPWFLYFFFLMMTFAPWVAKENLGEFLQLKRIHDLNFGELYGVLVLYFSLVLLAIPFVFLLLTLMLLLTPSNPIWLIIIGVILLVVLCCFCCGWNESTAAACVATRQVSYLGIIISYIPNFFVINLYGVVLGPWAYWIFEFGCAAIFAIVLMTTAVSGND